MIMIELPEDISSLQSSSQNKNKCDDQSSFVFKKGLAKIGSDISYAHFFENYLIPNQPCIIESNFTQHWTSRKDWVISGAPNFDFLKNYFGSAKVPVANCNKQFYNAQEKCDTTLEEFLQYWDTYIKNGYSNDLPCLYLKDWHFTRDFPNYEAYGWPKLFASDWLNEFWSTKCKDDYRFVYMGPKGSWTPLHVDVLTSYSWSSNICGRKRWLLFPPGSEKQLCNAFGDLPFDENLVDKCNEAIEVEQSAGETLFVPSGWHHQVWNLEDTISINHNWLNGCSISNSWTGLLEALAAVRQELNDCKEMEGWEEQCQLVLAATTGADIKDFLKLLSTIAHARIQCLKGIPTTASSHWQLGYNHARYDLKKVLDILPEIEREMSDSIELASNLKYEIEKALS